MSRPMKIPVGLCADEAVAFIAGRHHTSPERLLAAFLLTQRGGAVDAEASAAVARLEENEREILRGLAHACHLL